MAEKHGKDAQGFAFEGKANPGFHHEGVYGTAEGDRTEGSHAPDIRIRRGLGGDAVRRTKRERELDQDADAFFRAKGIDPDKL